MDRYRKYLEQALADETTAIEIYLNCIEYAPYEDLPKIVEIITDELDHKAIVTDILGKHYGQGTFNQVKLTNAD